MKTKVLEDGSLYAKVKSLDNSKTVQFLTVSSNHSRNRGSLHAESVSAEYSAANESSQVFSVLVGDISEKISQEDKRDDFILTDIRDEEAEIFFPTKKLKKQQKRRIRKHQNMLIDSMDMETTDEIVGIMETMGLNCASTAISANVNTKYKTVGKKVFPLATPLPSNASDIIQATSIEEPIRKTESIGHNFTDETLQKLKIGNENFLRRDEKKEFLRMLKNGKAFSFKLEELGCANPRIISPMVIFTVPHVLWKSKPIPIPKATLPRVTEILIEKARMRIIEPCFSPYTNRWFTIKKKDGSLRFIQDLQPANSITIRNMAIGLVVDAFAEAFAGYSIYSQIDLFSAYDQFQLAKRSRDLTAFQSPIGLTRMCVLPQGATNSVGHIATAMNKILKEFIPDKTQPYIDDIPIKGVLYSARDSTEVDGLRKFVKDHMDDVKMILKGFRISK